MSSVVYKGAMRPLHHPSIDNVTVEGLIHALSDPVRVRIFAEIAAADCAKTCSNFLVVDDRPLPKSTLSQHFRVLREAGLIRSERHGVEVRNTTRCAELKARFGPLLSAIVDAYRAQGQRQARKERGR